MLLEVVDQTPGGADQDVDARRQRVALFLIAGTAEHQPDAKPGVAGEEQGIVVDLHRQFPGGRHDQCARLGRVVGRWRLRGQQTLQDHQEEGGGLAGAGLGLARDVLAGERNGQCGGLNRGTVGESGVGETFKYTQIKVKVVEPGRGQVCLCH